MSLRQQAADFAERQLSSSAKDTAQQNLDAYRKWSRYLDRLLAGEVVGASKSIVRCTCSAHALSCQSI